MAAYSNQVIEKVQKLEDEIEVLEKKVTRLKREIEQVQAGDCPIQPGDTIEWIHVKERVNGDKRTPPQMRRGQVITVESPDYRGSYRLRCNVLNAKGIAIGFASVDEERCPSLIKKAKPVKSSRKKAKNARFARAYGASKKVVKRVSK